MTAPPFNLSVGEVGVLLMFSALFNILGAAFAPVLVTCFGQLTTVSVCCGSARVDLAHNRSLHTHDRIEKCSPFERSILPQSWPSWLRCSSSGSDRKNTDSCWSGCS
jgi:hypothetical protein